MEGGKLLLAMLGYSVVKASRLNGALSGILGLEGRVTEGQQQQQKYGRRKWKKIKKPKGVGHFLKIGLCPHVD